MKKILKTLLIGVVAIFLFIVIVRPGEKANETQTGSSAPSTEGQAGDIQIPRVDSFADLKNYNRSQDILNNEWQNEEPITILGYDDHVMEVGISADGKYFLFNDEGGPSDKDMYWSTRVDDTTYQFGGLVENTKTQAVDGTPSFNAKGEIYYTSTSDYANKFRTMYKASFADGIATDIEFVEGNVYAAQEQTPPRPGWISLDPDVSADDQYLVYSSGLWGETGFPFPYPFNVQGAELKRGEYERVPNRIFANINTENLEYAPAISDDGLELFFTRIGMDNGKPAFLGIYTATRQNTDEPFGNPERITAITGTVEAPVLSGDEKYLYYHRMVNNVWKPYRVTRK